jgi:hypothetical protein
MGYNTTFNTTPQPQQTLGGLLSPLSNMNQQIKSSPILNPTSTPVQSGLVSNTANSNTHTVTSNPQTGATVTKPTSNAGVLAQQQALNKLGAGLVEDGIAGPKTAAAIAKYGTGSTSSSTGTSGSSSPTQDTNSADKYNIYTGQPNPNYVDPNAPANTNYNSSNPASFSGLINQGANVSGNAATTGATNYNTANQSLLNATAGNQQYQDNAANIANTAGQQISDIGQIGARGEAGYLTTGTSPVGEGNSAILAQSTAAQQQAVSQGANMQLAGNAQGLTGQAQQQSGYNQVSGNALTGQGQGITGLNNAATLGQPKQQGYVNLNPLNPDTTGGGTASSAATMGAKIESDYQNALTGGLAPTTAANTVYQKAYSDYQDLTQSVQNVDSFGSLLTTGMTDAQGNTINPTDSKWANQSISSVRNQLSSQQQAQFDSTYAALKSKVSGLLSIGGSEIPTQITSDANKILDGSAPYGTLNATLQRIQTEGNILLTTQAQKVNTALTQIKGGNTSTSTNTNGGTGVFSDSSFYGQQ